MTNLIIFLFAFSPIAIAMILTLLFEKDLNIKNVIIIRKLYNLYDNYINCSYTMYLNDIPTEAENIHIQYKEALLLIKQKYNLPQNKFLKLNEKAIRLWREKNTI